MQYFGHFIPTNTGFCCFRRLDNVSNFRICATGVTLANAPTTSIVKKLKLTGTPFKVYKNTCYIQGIFNSNLEVQRFIGAKIRSVSGIRGQVKKACTDGQPGNFRATFEDKLKLSDIVFIRTWMPVDIPTLNLPILNHCEARLMRTKAQLANDTMVMPCDEYSFEVSLKFSHNLFPRFRLPSIPILIVFISQLKE